jgi:DNA-binding transcriptional regulator LsrR (DeoR family)
MSRQEIADCLGLTEATISRSLGQLAKKGVVWVLRAHEVVILRRELLEAIAEGSAHLVARRRRFA